MAGRKLPYMEFFTGDWMKDPALRAVSIAARGLWIDVLCLMWESDRRGYLVHRTGSPVTIEQLSRMVGCSEELADRLIQELEQCGVCSRSGDGVLYSRRMERDEAKRQVNVRNGRRGGNPALITGPHPGSDNRPRNPPVKRVVNRGDNRPDNPSSSASTSTSSPPPPSPAVPAESGGSGEGWGEVVEELIDCEMNAAIKIAEVCEASGWTVAKARATIQHWRDNRAATGWSTGILGYRLQSRECARIAVEKGWPEAKADTSSAPPAAGLETAGPSPQQIEANRKTLLDRWQERLNAMTSPERLALLATAPESTRRLAAAYEPRWRSSPVVADALLAAIDQQHP